MTRFARLDVARATRWGVLIATFVVGGIYFGSRRLRDFDAALVPYDGAAVFSACGLGYRYSMWPTKPATHPYWWRGWRLFFAPSRAMRNIARLVGLSAVNVVAQRFIEKRSPMILLKAAHPPAGATTLIISLGIVTRPLHLS